MVVDIVKFPQRRADELPDSEHVYHDFRVDRVDTMYRFVATYEFDGDTWEIEIWAHNFSEAKRKLASVHTGRIDGQVYNTVDA